MQHKTQIEQAVQRAIEILEGDRSTPPLNPTELPQASSGAGKVAKASEWDATAQADNLLGAIAYTSPLLPLPNTLKERLFDRLALKQPTSCPTDLEALHQQASQVVWEPYQAAPNTVLGKLSINSQTREIQCFVRAFSGTQFPQHRHAGDEEIIVLEGDLVIDGVQYGRGDRITSLPGTTHHPATQTGCLVYIRTSIDDEIF